MLTLRICTAEATWVPSPIVAFHNAIAADINSGAHSRLRMSKKVPKEIRLDMWHSAESSDNRQRESSRQCHPERWRKTARKMRRLASPGQSRQRAIAPQLPEIRRIRSSLEVFESRCHRNHQQCPRADLSNTNSLQPGVPALVSSV